ncbi:MAG: peptide-methionine (R)-S-oxide reductase MsrB [Pseudomonadota bacterium]
MQRRHFLGLIGVTGAATLIPGVSLGYVRVNLERAEDIEPLELSEAEWRERLTRDEFWILRDHGTEEPFSSPLDAETREGEYRCAGCDLLLFTSAMKYDSGTGWPSFFEHVEGHLLSQLDFSMLLPRTEYHCARCGGHQGHVFDDGPDPTGLRWCNNGLALSFHPAPTSSGA